MFKIVGKRESPANEQAKIILQYQVPLLEFCLYLLLVLNNENQKLCA